MNDESKRLDIVIPEEASERGPFPRGELRKEQFSLPDILAQFERITPHTRNTRIPGLPLFWERKVAALRKGFNSRHPISFKVALM